MKCQYCKTNTLHQWGKGKSCAGNHSYLLTGKSIRVCDDCNNLEVMARIKNVLNKK